MLPAAAAPRPQLLLVESDPAVRELLVELVAEAPYTLVPAATLSEAIALLHTRTFALILTDSFSPTPTEVLAPTAPLRQAAGSTPVVLFTAYRVDDAAVRAAGFSGCIPKPFEVEDLLRRIAELTAPQGNM